MRKWASLKSRSQGVNTKQTRGNLNLSKKNEGKLTLKCLFDFKIKDRYYSPPKISLASLFVFWLLQEQKEILHIFKPLLKYQGITSSSTWILILYYNTNSLIDWWLCAASTGQCFCVTSIATLHNILRNISWWAPTCRFLTKVIDCSGFKSSQRPLVVGQATWWAEKRCLVAEMWSTICLQQHEYY